jgi:hypothetical protein
VRETFEIVNIGRALAGAEAIAPKSGARFHFSLPGSVQGFVCEDSPEARGTVQVENVDRGDLDDSADVWHRRVLACATTASRRARTAAPPRPPFPRPTRSRWRLRFVRLADAVFRPAHSALVYRRPGGLTATRPRPSVFIAASIPDR